MLSRVIRFLKRLFGGDGGSIEPQGYRVIIFGAGSSRAQWQSEHADSPALPLPPPLNVDFFDIAKQMHSDWAESTWRVIEQLWRQRNGGDDCPTQLTLEDAFHFVFEHAIDNPDDTNARLLYGNCMLLVESVIAATTNPLCQTLCGPIGELLYFSSRAPHIGKLAVINFNYDLLVERTVAHIMHTEAAAFPFPQVYRFPFFNFDSPNNPVLHKEHTERICLLKPHGSLNWVIDSRYALYPAELKRLGFAEVHLFPDLQVPLDEQSRLDTSQYDTTTPFIIPPTHAKEKIQLAWLKWQDDEVLGAVGAASEIVVFGYSFPEADRMSHSILECLSKRTSCLEKLVVFDPSPRVAELLQRHVRACPVDHATEVHMALWSGILSPFRRPRDETV